MKDALENVTYCAYDAVGNQIRVSDPEGHITYFTYDALNRLVETEQV